MRFRKTLSLLLVLAMIMSTAPLNVQAETESIKDVSIQEDLIPENDVAVTPENDTDAIPEYGSEETDPDGSTNAGSGSEESIDESPETNDPVIIEQGTENDASATPEDDAAVTPENDTDAITEGEDPAAVDSAAVDPDDAESAEEETESGEADNEKPVSTRTIMMYICGSNLETYSAMATYNIRQILDSEFSKDEQVKFVIMTGGSDEWHTPSELLVDPSHPDQTVNIDPEYNQIWEAKGKDAEEHPGKMVLLEKTGLHDEKARDKEDEEYSGEVMSDPDLLKDFIDYCVDLYPAEKYDLILWDHGSGPLGGFANDEARFFGEMSFPEMMDAFSDNAVTKDGGKFDFINFDACLMGSAELALVFSDYTDYYIASPENIPGYGEYYTGWLNTLGEEPDYDTYKLGKQIVDDYIAFYEDDSDERTSGEGTLAVIDMNKLAYYYGFTETLAKLPVYLKEQATVPNPELNDILFYDEFDSGKNSIRYGGDMNYYDLGTLISQLSFDFKELTPGDVLDDGTVIDENIYTEPLAEINALLYEKKDMIYARGTRGIRSKPLYHRDIYGRTQYDTVGTSGLYLYFPTADNANEVSSYYSILKSVIERLEEKLKALESKAEALDADDPEALDLEIQIREEKSRLSFFREYRLALIDYALISKTGRTVTRMLDEGYDRSSVNYDSFREFLTGGATYDPSIEDLEADENIDYTICDWTAEYMDYLLLRAGMSTDSPYSEHAAAEAVSRDWMNDVITQQARENISRKDMSLEEMGENGSGGYRIHMKNTQKRVVEDVRYNLTARIPAAEEYLNMCQERGEFELMTDDEKEDLINARIGVVSGTPVLEKEDGTPVNQDSRRDYLDWYLEPGGTWELPTIDDSWYTVCDVDGYCHVANIETDEEAGEIYFYGNYKSENGIDTLCCLSFNKDGDLEDILLGTEDGNSYRRIPASEMVGEVEVMPIRQATIFVDDVSIPLSQKPIVVSPETTGKIKLVKKDLNEIDDLKKPGEKAVIERTIVVRDIYGYEIPITEEDEEFAITYDLNGGVYDGSSDDIVEKYASGTVISIHEAPVRDGYEFLYWKGSEYQPGDEYTVTGDHTFTAQWKKAGTPAADPEDPAVDPEDPAVDPEDPSGDPDTDVDDVSDTDPNNDPGVSSKGVRTGDESRLYVWLAVSAAALFLLIGLYIYRRKQEKN